MLTNPTPEVVRHVRQLADVPMWTPHPMPAGWGIAGVAYAGDDRSRARAIAVACHGPAPLGGPADMVVVAEEPGAGLGAGCAGFEFVDPGAEIGGPPAAKVYASGHPTPLWTIYGPTDRSAFVGEASGLWIWIILWPMTAGYLLVEKITFDDLRDELPHDLTALMSPSAALHLYPSGNRPQV